MEPLEDGAPSVSSPAEVPVVDAGSSPAELQLVAGLVRRAKADGVAMTGPDGLLKTLTKTVIETALQEEMTDHLGYGKHAVEGRNLGNSRNGTRSKTVVTDNCGEVEIAVPRDRDGSFAPQLIGKRQRRLSDLASPRRHTIGTIPARPLRAVVLGRSTKASLAQCDMIGRYHTGIMDVWR